MTQIKDLTEQTTPASADVVLIDQASDDASRKVKLSNLLQVWNLVAPANTLTLVAASPYTLTIPATGTAALLGTANVFTAVQKINVNSTTALVVEQDGVKDNVLVVDTLNGRVGVGVALPSAVMDIQGNGETSYWATTYSDTLSTQNVYRRARGTQAIPTAVQSGDSLGGFSFRGYDGSVFTGSRGSIDVRANENWVSGSANGTRMLFSTTPNGSTALAERLRFANAECVFNENSLNYDLRAEGDTNANMLFLDASADAILFGTATQVVGAGITLGLDTGVTDAKNIILGTTTGSKIGTATSQKLSFWNAAPIVQPTTAIAAATFAANTSGIVDDTATFDGYTIGQIVKALRNVGLLA